MEIDYEKIMWVDIWNIHNFLIRMNIDILVLTGAGSDYLDDFIHFRSGIDNSKRVQAGISIHNHNTILERIITATFEFETIVIGIYSPVDDSSQVRRDSHYATSILIIGDFNVRIGNKMDNRVVRRFGEDALNDSGERFINIIIKNGLLIGNSFLSNGI